MDFIENEDTVQKLQLSALSKIGNELEIMNSMLGAIWSVLAPEEEVIYPISISDEYLTIPEAAERLHVKEKYIVSLILSGMRNPKTGWIQGLHYIVLDGYDVHNPKTPEEFTKHQAHMIRIPWKATLKRLTFLEQKNRKTQLIDLHKLNRTDHNHKVRYSQRNFKIMDDLEATEDLEIPLD